MTEAMKLPPLSGMGRLYADSLRDHNPEKWMELKTNGGLAAHLEETNAAIEQSFQTALAHLRKQHSPDRGPENVPPDSIAIAQMDQALGSAARELMMDAFLIRPPEEPEEPWLDLSPESEAEA